MKSFLQQNKARDQQVVLNVLQNYPATTEQLIEELGFSRKALLDATHSLEQSRQIWKKGKYWHLKESQLCTDEQNTAES